MNDKLKNIDLSKFKFFIQDETKFADIDSFGVVHNIQYLYWIEWSRTQYFKNLGLPMTPTTFTKDYPFMVVHTDIDYLNSLKLGDSYKVFSRISHLNNSSLNFENIVVSSKEIPIVFASSVLVYLNIKSNESVRIPDSLRDLIRNYEISLLENK